MVDDPEVEVAAPPPPPVVEIPAILSAPQSFLAGAAGCGKTFLAKAWSDQQTGVVLAASTGIAACNLGSGTTINALLGYFDTASLVEMYTTGRLTSKLRRLSQSGVRRILLDEISMVDGEQLTVITRALDELNGEGYILDAETSEAVAAHTLAPIGLTVVGDFCQLPPVKAPFAFESAEWARYAASTHTLTEIRRQADRDFIEALRGARRGDADLVCDYFGPRLQRTADPNFDGPTILGTNDAVSRFNALRLDKVPGRVHQFASRRWGKERGDWKNIPETLHLKVGALVMILANQREEDSTKLIYANGDLGHLTEITDGSRVIVTLQRTGEPVEVNWVTRQYTIPLEPGRRKQLKAEGKAHLAEKKMEIVGEVTYLPLRVAYASTCHKSQGLSLDQVQVNTSEHFFTQAGLLYVAMSRARSAEGLRLVGHVDGLRGRCTVHPKVRPYV